MKILNLLLGLLLLFSGWQISLGQSKNDSGHIKMEITDIYSENEQMMAMSGMLKGSYTDIYFTPEKSYTKANMMGGMSETIFLLDHKTNENLMLMSIMGNKVRIKMNENELKEFQSGDTSGESMSYNHKRDETKDILGFKCHKVEVGIGGTDEVTMTLWVTDQIKTIAHITNGIQMDQLGGFPLEYVISLAGQMDMTMTAVKYENEFDHSIFSVKTDGYEEMTLEEFMESMGGSMGGF